MREQGKVETGIIPSRPARDIRSNAPSRYPALQGPLHPHRGTFHLLVTSRFGTAPIDTTEKKVPRLAPIQT